MKASVLGALRNISTHYLDDGRPFVCGSDPTVGDYFLFEAVDRMCAYVGEDIVTADLPTAVARHRDRVRRRPGVAALFDSDGVFKRLSASPHEETLQPTVASLWVAGR